MANGSVDCGNGQTCPAGNRCSRDGKHCLSQDTVDCGAHFCGAGYKCGSADSCLRQDAVDCGGGKSCPATNKCSKGGGCIPEHSVDCGSGRSCPTGNLCVNGGAECLTPKELADRRAAEKRQQEEKVELDRKLAQQATIQKRQDQELSDWLKNEQVRLAKLKAKETTSSQLQTVIAGQQPNSPNTYSFNRTTYGTIEVFQNGKRVATVTPDYAAQNYGYSRASTASKTPSVTAVVVATPSTVGTPAPSAGSATVASPTGSSATTKLSAPASSGNIWQKLSSDQASGLAAAANQNSTTSLQPTVFQNSSQKLGTTITGQTTSSGNFFAAIYQSSPTQTLIDGLAAAGGTALGNSASKTVRVGTNVVSYGLAGGQIALLLATANQRPWQATAVQTGQIVADTAAVDAAGRLGGPVGAFAMQTAIDVQKQTVAPVLGNLIFQKWPDAFIPASSYQPVQIDPFTGQPVSQTK